MDEPQVYDWYENNSSRSRPIDIKVEASLLEPTFPLLSSPPPPTPPRSAPTSWVSEHYHPSRQRSNTSAVSHKRNTHYPSRSRHNSPESIDMAAAPAYQSWVPSSAKGFNGRSSLSEARSAPDDSSAFVLGSFSSPPFLPRAFELDNRPASSNSSTLTGAMGDAQLSAHGSRHSGSSSSSRDSPPYHMSVQSDLDWPASHAPQPMSITSQQPYENISGSSPYNGHLISSGSNSYLQQVDHKPSSFAHGPSPSSYPSTSTVHSSPSHHYVSSMHSHGAPAHDKTIASTPGSFHTVCRPGTDRFETELQHLRKRVHELELINEHARNRIKTLETELANDTSYASQGSSIYSSRRGVPSPHTTPAPSPHFNMSWKARTDARIKLYCSLNRAGNALCAWHDSRRERRAHPPRMAPPGHLNCGCTHEEALFEESLARHDVGSYHPGESVRMDPALRNPLLRLLQARYGYKDGDFERDPQTGDWLEGEGHDVWEQRAQHGLASARQRSARVNP